MTCDSWRARCAIGLGAAFCALFAACSSKPPVAPATPALPLNKDCAFTVNQGGDLRMACMLDESIPDAQVDADHPGSTACSKTSYSVFRQDISTAVQLSYGLKGDDSSLRVRVGGPLGPGRHTGKIAKAAGNDCDAMLSPVGEVATRFGGDYTALIDKTQSPLCVAQSRLNLGSFNQTQTLAVPKDLGGVLRDSTRDALQQRLDLEVARQVNKLVRPGDTLPEAAVNRHGRCPDGFRTLAGL